VQEKDPRKGAGTTLKGLGSGPQAAEGIKNSEKRAGLIMSTKKSEKGED